MLAPVPSSSVSGLEVRTPAFQSRQTSTIQGFSRSQYFSEPLFLSWGNRGGGLHCWEAHHSFQSPRIPGYTSFPACLSMSVPHDSFLCTWLNNLLISPATSLHPRSAFFLLLSHPTSSSPHYHPWKCSFSLLLTLALVDPYVPGKIDGTGKSNFPHCKAS